MKRNIKKILILLSMIVCVFGITACSSNNVTFPDKISEFDILIAIGMVLIIILLILLLIISIRIIVRMDHNTNEKVANRNISNEAVDNAIAQIIQKEDSEMKEMELVAVITAAIAAAEGISTEGFVVRSIKKANKNAWQKA